MKKLVLLVALVCAMLCNVVFAAGEKGVVNPDGVMFGYVYVGMPIPDVISMYGEPTSKHVAYNDTGALYYGTPEKGLTVFVNYRIGKVTGAEVKGNVGIATTTGVTYGMSRADVFAILGEPDAPSDNVFSYLAKYNDDDVRGRFKITMNPTTDTVEEFGIYTGAKTGVRVRVLEQ